MVNSERGKQLGAEVWKEMVDIFEEEAPEIKDIISAP